MRRVVRILLEALAYTGVALVTVVLILAAIAVVVLHFPIVEPTVAVSFPC